jgi:hypothetical protein
MNRLFLIKATLGGLGLLATLLGMAFDFAPLLTAAVVLLGGALVVRLLQYRDAASRNP